jgi:hypothetical protein
MHDFENLYNIRKIAESNLGVVYSEEFRRKCSDSKKGFVFTEEHKRKISESKQGFSPMLGKKFTQSHKDKIRESNRGLVRTEEVKQKMRDGFNYNVRRHVFSVKCIETNEVFTSYSEAAIKFGVSITTISNAAKYNKVVSKKYHFEKVD